MIPAVTKSVLCEWAIKPYDLFYLDHQDHFFKETVLPTGKIHLELHEEYEQHINVHLLLSIMRTNK